MANTTAGSAAQEPVSPIKKQLIARIQELKTHVINIKAKIKHPDTYYRDQHKLENFFKSLDIYFTIKVEMNEQGKILFTAFFLRDTAAS